MTRRESQETRLLNRREFGGLCVALSSFVTSTASALDAASGVASKGAGRTVKFRDGIVVPVLGQGSGHVGQGRRPAAVEEEALRTGVSLGMVLIDTAESYGEGRSEELISHVIADQRDHVFLVSKVETDHVAGDGIARACEASLARLRTNYLDLYLLHWPVPTRREAPRGRPGVRRPMVGASRGAICGRIRSSVLGLSTSSKPRPMHRAERS